MSCNCVAVLLTLKASLNFSLAEGSVPFGGVTTEFSLETVGVFFLESSAFSLSIVGAAGFLMSISLPVRSLYISGSKGKFSLP